MPVSARPELIQARNVLLRRKASTTDEAERATIDDALAELNDSIEAIDTEELLRAAGRVARANDALERVVASARMGPFDNFLADIQAAMSGLQAKLDAMQATERLPLAPVEAEAAPAASAAPVPTDRAPAPALPAVSHGPGFGAFPGAIAEHEVRRTA